MHRAPALQNFAALLCVSICLSERVRGRHGWGRAFRDRRGSEKPTGQGKRRGGGSDLWRRDNGGSPASLRDKTPDRFLAVPKRRYFLESGFAAKSGLNHIGPAALIGIVRAVEACDIDLLLGAG